MACLDMHNSEYKAPPMSPRISFSNDFFHTQQILKQPTTTESPPLMSSSDFEFSVSNFSMLSADELFFKGRLLPFKDHNHGNGSNQMQRTIRDELLNGDNDDDDDEVSLKPPKGSSSTIWKGLLGHKRSHIGSKKVDKATGSYVDRVAPETRRSNIFGYGDIHDVSN